MVAGTAIEGYQPSQAPSASLGVIADLDPESAARVDTLVTKLPGRLEAPPHVTLGGGYPLDAAGDLAARVQQLAGGVPPLRLQMSALGTFGDSSTGFVLFLAPVVTDDLLELHRRFHQAIGAHADRCVPYYLPGRWVPHVTLAVGLDPAALATGMGQCAAGWAPFSAGISALSLVQYPPVRILDRWPLAS